MKVRPVTSGPVFSVEQCRCVGLCACLLFKVHSLSEEAVCLSSLSAWGYTADCSRQWPGRASLLQGKALLSQERKGQLPALLSPSSPPDLGPERTQQVRGVWKTRASRGPGGDHLPFPLLEDKARSQPSSVQKKVLTRTPGALAFYC